MAGGGLSCEFHAVAGEADTVVATGGVLALDGHAAAQDGGEPRLLLQGGELLGENVEEAVSDWLNSNLDSVVYGNGDGSTLKESFGGQMPWTPQGLVTMLTSLIMSGSNVFAGGNVTSDTVSEVVDTALDAEEQIQQTTPEETEGATERDLTPEAAPVEATPAETAELPVETAETPATEPGRTAPTQARFTEQALEGTPLEGRTTHEVHSDAQVNAEADARMQDRAGETSRLFGDEHQTWGDTDTEVAKRLISEAITKAKETGDWNEVARLRRVYDAEGTRAGQEMRQRRTFKNTPDDIISAAADTLYGKTTTGLDTSRKMTDAEKAEVMKNVEQFANDAASIPEGDTAAVIEQIKKLNKARHTTGLFSKETGRMVNKMLEWVSKQDGGEAYLRNLLNAQVQGYADDFRVASKINQAKTFRVMNLLSNFATFMRNFTANGVFDPLETLSNNIALPFDMLLSKISGKRGVAYNRAVFSGAKWQGKGSGFIKSALQVMLDAEFDGTTGKYEPGSRLFKMGGGAQFFERLLSTYQMVENLALKSTDEYTKSGVRAEALRGYERFVEQGILSQKEAEEMADNIAKERTLQEDSAFSRGFKKARDAANTAGIRDKRGGSLGAGDLLLTFAQVPANVGLMNFRMNPFAGGAIALKNMVSAIESAKNGTLTADQQRKAALSVGRAINGLGLTVIGMVLSAKGIIKVARGDDKDKTALEKSEGRNGLQINLSAFKRLLGGEDTDWQTGDDLMSIGFLEQFAGQLMLGDLLYHGYKEDGRLPAREIASANAESLFETMLALPAVSQLSDIRNSWKYSEAEDAIGKVGDVLTDFGGNVASSFLVPNGVRAIARGTDNTVRNTYSSGTTAGDVFDYFRSGVPVLRQQLPSSVDSWGQEQHYTDSNVQNFLNSVILPGAITQYNTNDVNQELARLYEAGFDKVYPDRPANKAEVNGRQLDADALRQFNINRGTTDYDALASLFPSTIYQNMMDDDKAKAISAMEQYANAVAKDMAGNQKDVDRWIVNAYNANRRGGDAVGYLAMYAMYDTKAADAYLNLTESGVNSNAAATIMALIDRRGGVSQENVAKAIRELGLDDAGASTVWDAFGWKDSWEKYSKKH